MSRGERIAAGSVGIGCAVLGLKTAAWLVTGSAAFFSDALETTVNVAASLIALYAVRLAGKPADAGHPYGHQKAEFFAAVIEGVLIVVAALLIFAKAWAAFRAPHVLLLPLRGIAFSAMGTVLNAGWALLLLRTGAGLRSPALTADGWHLMADVATSLAVITGVGLAVLTGRMIIDPIVAALAGVYVLWSGLGMISSSVGGLMDAAPDPSTVTRIREILADSAAGAIEAHDLRMRHAGRLTYVEFHLVVPGAMTVAEAHAICDRIEGRLRAEMDYLVITIHVEPEDKAKHHGVPIL